MLNDTENKSMEILQAMTSKGPTIDFDLVDSQKEEILKLKEQIQDLMSKFSNQPSTTVKPEPGTTNNNITVFSLATIASELLDVAGSKYEIQDASKAIEKLKEVNGVLNATVFRAKFKDYMIAMGLERALAAVVVQQLDVETGSTADVYNQGLIAELLIGAAAAYWRMAHTKLKSSIDGDLYTTLVLNPAEASKESFFTLWARIDRLAGETGSQDEVVVLMQEWESLILSDGQRLSEHITVIDKIANRINSIEQNETFTDFLKISKLQHTLKDFPTYRAPLDLHKAGNSALGGKREKCWATVKQNFFKFAPRGKNMEELPNTSGTTPSHVANAATANAGRCTISGHGGHLASECRQSKSKDTSYTGFSVRNNECRKWVNSGRCDWLTHPKNTSKKACKFNHGPSTRNKGNWDESKRTVIQEQEANAAVNIPPPCEQQDNVVQQVNFLTKMVKNMYNQDKAPAEKQAPAHHPQSMITIMTDDTTERFGFVCSAQKEADDSDELPELVDDSDTEDNTEDNTKEDDEHVNDDGSTSDGSSMPSLAHSVSSEESEEEEGGLKECYVPKVFQNTRQAEWKAAMDAEWAATDRTDPFSLNHAYPDVYVTTSEEEGDDTDEFPPAATTTTTITDQVELNHRPLGKPSALPLSYGPRLLFKPLTLLLVMLTLLFGVVYQGNSNVAEANSAVRNEQHEVLLDTGCTDSATGLLGWLTNRVPTWWTMSTANNGKSKATCRGQATVARLRLNMVHVPDFRRTLISWTDLNDMGMTGTMGKDKIDIYDLEGKHWTTVHKGKDRLWHFTEVEQEQANLIKENTL